MTEEMQLSQLEVSVEKSLENDSIAEDSNQKISGSEYFDDEASRILIEEATILLLNTDALENTLVQDGSINKTKDDSNITPTTSLPSELEQLNPQKDFSEDSNELPKVTQEIDKNEENIPSVENSEETNLTETPILLVGSGDFQKSVQEESNLEQDDDGIEPDTMLVIDFDEFQNDVQKNNPESISIQKDLQGTNNNKVELTQEQKRLLLKKRLEEDSSLMKMANNILGSNEFQKDLDSVKGHNSQKKIEDKNAELLDAKISDNSSLLPLSKEDKNAALLDAKISDDSSLLPLSNIALTTSKFVSLQKLVLKEASVKKGIEKEVGKGSVQKFLKLVKRFQEKEFIEENVVENVVLYHKVRNIAVQCVEKKLNAVYYNPMMVPILNIETDNVEYRSAIENLEIFVKGSWTKKVIKAEELNFDLEFLNILLTFWQNNKTSPNKKSEENDEVSKVKIKSETKIGKSSKVKSKSKPPNKKSEENDEVSKVKIKSETKIDKSSKVKSKSKLNTKSDIKIETELDIPKSIKLETKLEPEESQEDYSSEPSTLVIDLDEFQKGEQKMNPEGLLLQNGVQGTNNNKVELSQEQKRLLFKKRLQEDSRLRQTANKILGSSKFQKDLSSLKGYGLTNSEGTDDKVSKAKVKSEIKNDESTMAKSESKFNSKSNTKLEEETENKPRIPKFDFNKIKLLKRTPCTEENNPDDPDGIEEDLDNLYDETESEVTPKVVSDKKDKTLIYVDPMVKISCNLCTDDASTNFEDIVKHYSLNHFNDAIEKAYITNLTGPCDLCKKEFVSKQELIVHIGLEHDVVELQISFTNAHKGDKKATNYNDKIKCKYCSFLSDFSSMKKHYSAEHFIVKLEEKCREENLLTPDNRCSFCNETAESTKELVKHLGVNHNKIVQFMTKVSSKTRTNANQNLIVSARCKAELVEGNFVFFEDDVVGNNDLSTNSDSLHDPLYDSSMINYSNDEPKETIEVKETAMVNKNKIIVPNKNAFSLAENLIKSSAPNMGLFNTTQVIRKYTKPESSKNNISKSKPESTRTNISKSIKWVKSRGLPKFKQGHAMQQQKQQSEKFQKTNLPEINVDDLKPKISMTPETNLNRGKVKDQSKIKTPLHCNICGEVFSSNDILNKHLIISHYKNLLQSKLKEQQLQTNVAAVACPSVDCRKVFKDEEYLLVHFANRHTDFIKKINSNPEETPESTKRTEASNNNTDSSKPKFTFSFSQNLTQPQSNVTASSQSSTTSLKVEAPSPQSAPNTTLSLKVEIPSPQNVTFSPPNTTPSSQILIPSFHNLAIPPQNAPPSPQNAPPSPQNVSLSSQMFIPSLQNAAIPPQNSPPSPQNVSQCSGSPESINEKPWTCGPCKFATDQDNIFDNHKKSLGHKFKVIQKLSKLQVDQSSLSQTERICLICNKKYPEQAVFIHLETEHKLEHLENTSDTEHRLGDLKHTGGSISSIIIKEEIESTNEVEKESTNKEENESTIKEIIPSNQEENELTNQEENELTNQEENELTNQEENELTNQEENELTNPHWFVEFKKFCQERRELAGVEDCLKTNFRTCNTSVFTCFLKNILVDSENISKFDDILKDIGGRITNFKDDQTDSVLDGQNIQSLQIVKQYKLLKDYEKHCKNFGSNLRDCDPMYVIIFLSQLMGRPEVTKTDMKWTLLAINDFHNGVNGDPLKSEQKIVDFFKAINIPIYEDKDDKLSENSSKAYKEKDEPLIERTLHQHIAEPPIPNAELSEDSIKTAAVNLNKKSQKNESSIDADDKTENLVLNQISKKIEDEPIARSRLRRRTVKSAQLLTNISRETKENLCSKDDEENDMGQTMVADIIEDELLPKRQSQSLGGTNENFDIITSHLGVDDEKLVSDMLKKDNLVNLLPEVKLKKIKMPIESKAAKISSACEQNKTLIATNEEKENLEEQPVEKNQEVSITKKKINLIPKVVLQKIELPEEYKMLALDNANKEVVNTMPNKKESKKRQNDIDDEIDTIPKKCEKTKLPNMTKSMNMQNIKELKGDEIYSVEKKSKKIKIINENPSNTQTEIIKEKVPEDKFDDIKKKSNKILSKTKSKKRANNIKEDEIDSNQNTSKKIKKLLENPSSTVTENIKEEVLDISNNSPDTLLKVDNEEQNSNNDKSLILVPLKSEHLDTDEEADKSENNLTNKVFFIGDRYIDIISE